MVIMVYDGSFEGLLTTVFEVYEYKFEQPLIFRHQAPAGSLFGKLHNVVASNDKSSRVYKKLQQSLSPKAVKQLYDTYLSELKDIENVLLRYIQSAISSRHAIENDYTNPDVLMVQQTSRKVHREKHRMEAFVRFQLTKDGLYYCIIQPDYNVLPLISKHFKNRYADQQWLIYDSQRKYGLYYNGETVEEVQINFSDIVNSNSVLKEINDDKEELYQKLWQQYFVSVNIPARRNMKLHIQHMPRRYWRYLTEKQQSLPKG